MANTERMPIVTYTDTVAPYRVKFVFRQPPLPYVANIFSLPFSSQVWVALAVCSLISSFAIYLASRWEVQHGKVRMRKFEEKFKLKLLFVTVA